MICLFCVWAASAIEGVGAIQFSSLFLFAKKSHARCLITKKSAKTICLMNERLNIFAIFSMFINFFCPIRKYNRRSNLSAWPTVPHLYVTNNNPETVDNGSTMSY